MEVILFVFIVGVYFFPTIVATLREHRNDVPVFVLNLFFGWTLIGWVAALIWACTDHCRPVRIDREV